jgi:hypothetical protein
MNNGASIVKLTKILGGTTNESLELIWKANEAMKIRKTGPKYDG